MSIQEMFAFKKIKNKILSVLQHMLMMLVYIK